MLTYTFPYFTSTKNLGIYIWELGKGVRQGKEQSIIDHVEFVSFGVHSRGYEFNVLGQTSSSK